MDHFAGLYLSVKKTSVCIVDDTGSIVRELKVVSEHEALLQFWEPALPLQTDKSRAAIAVAFQCACRSRFAGDLCRDAAHAGGVAGADQQDRPQRCARHGADDAGGTLSPGRPVSIKHGIKRSSALSEIGKNRAELGRLHAGGMPAIVCLVYPSQVGDGAMSCKAQPHLQIAGVTQIRAIAPEPPLQ
jgi:hypothetical protein